MGFLSRFEGKMEDGLEGAAGTMFKAPISPVQIAKKAEKAMRREKMVGAGQQYAPTLYTVLVNPMDDQRLFGYYPTLSGETETYLSAKAAEEGLLMDGTPLVRFIVDEDLRRGKFDVVAELVSAPIIDQLRQEEMARYGLAAKPARRPAAPQQRPRPAQMPPQAQPQQRPQQAYAPATPQPAAAPAPIPAPAVNPAPRVNIPSIDDSEIKAADYGDLSYQAPRAIPEIDPVAAPAPQQQPANHEFDFSGFDNYAGAPLSQPLETFDMAAAPLSAGPTRNFNDNAYAQQGAAAQPAVQARLINLANNQPYQLSSQLIIMGRGSASDIVLDDINASRQHAEIRFEPNGTWSITDLGSTNGTMVNDRPISSHLLQEGDRITIGMTTLMFTTR